MHLDGRFRFDNFIVGSANRLAVAAARAVAETPGTVYNPLFVYSGSGLGKTHLLGAIGHHVGQLQPGLLVEYISLEEFVEQLHAAISAGQTESFKTRYARVGVLLVDDVQFLTGRRETQSELLRLFNAMQATGGQIVLSSDRPPAEIADVDERLITRLAGGLIVDMGVPDLETRVAILRSKCEERGVFFDPAVLEELALLGLGNVRELQGALNRLIAHQAISDAPLRPDDLAVVFGSSPRAHRGGTPAGGSSGEFLSFVSGIATTVAQSVEPWKVRLGEAMAYWSGEGYRTAVFERAIEKRRAPDVEGMIGVFNAAVERLRALEAEATAIDSALGGLDVFRDAERVADAELLVEQARTGQMPPPGPSAAFSREGFEVGASNQLAVRAADAVVQEPARKYNPLFIHGPSGVGKTHLAHAIGNEVVAATGGASRVSVVGSQTFIDELIAALQEGTIERWRSRYRAADVLILDDVQFVARKERTQEELFHVFNALYDAGKQIVLTSDAEPKELAGLEDRLRSRFEGGLVVAIQPPDRALRERLYARALALVDPVPDPALVGYLADRPAASVREVMGTVHRLVAAAEVAGVPLSLGLARAELAGAGSAPAPAPTSAQTPVDTFFLDDEKVVWDWPEVAGRVIEELR
ncbi:MAG TPA: DnaA/Hda family protein [Gemmatimonadaceae bacterium]|nr:DnaA/Hda family protein [Gemmatimonadaceae bacterium]